MYPIAFVAGNMLIAFGNAIYYSKLDFIIPNIITLIINAGLITFLLVSFEYSKVEMPWSFIPGVFLFFPFTWRAFVFHIIYCIQRREISA
jgi:hypothetical protein